jgi:aminoglycoside phosphotransferase (APT) family kinase protein
MSTAGWTASLAELQQAPSAEILRRLCSTLVPGGRVGMVRRLRGGLQCGMHAVDLIAPTGERLRLVVRRYTAAQASRNPEVCLREWKTLTLLHESGVPAPRPVWLDTDGTLFGVPGLVMTRLPGRTLPATPPDINAYLRQLAETLAGIHQVPAGDDDLGWLPVFDAPMRLGRDLTKPRTDPDVTRRIAALAEGEALWLALQAHWPPAHPLPAKFIHGDYCTVNTLWRRGRITGVVDWGSAALGPPEWDIVNARCDVALGIGPEAPDRFLEAYVAVTSRPAPPMVAWDLIVCWGAALMIDAWAAGIADEGRTDLTAELLRDRLNAFVTDALRRAA